VKEQNELNLKEPTKRGTWSVHCVWTVELGVWSVERGTKWERQDSEVNK